MEHQEILYAPATIEFNEYATYKKKAMEVAAYIDSIVLTEDNVKEVKSTLADARKLVNALEDRRKAIKKEVMEPYKAFESQVKDITGIIDEADAKLRAQVRVMEEREREEKQAKITQLWNLRIMHYSFHHYVPGAFEHWLTPQHLNKSVSLRSCEDDMTDFMEKLEKDVNAILAMDNAEEVMTEYINTFDMTDALEAVRVRKEYQKQAFEKEDTATFVITGKANITLTEKLLEENGITYRRI